MQWLNILLFLNEVVCNKYQLHGQLASEQLVYFGDESTDVRRFFEIYVQMKSRNCVRGKYFCFELCSLIFINLHFDCIYFRFVVIYIQRCQIKEAHVAAKAAILSLSALHHFRWMLVWCL